METPLCPNCGKKLTQRTRRSDGHPFWGCTGFPTCRYSRDITDEQPVVTKELKPSKYQQAIFDWIKDPDGTDCVVEAVAGSGKTSTIVEALKYTSGKVAFVAFNKRIAEELQKIGRAHV